MADDSRRLERDVENKIDDIFGRLYAWTNQPSSQIHSQIAHAIQEAKREISYLIRRHWPSDHAE